MPRCRVMDSVSTGASYSSGDGDHQARVQQAVGDAYLIEGVIGRGGMATVYRALDRKHERRVALKVLAPDLAATLGSERFRREIRLVAGLQHTHILPVFDSGETDGLLWYTMPLVQGESLGDRLTRERQLPVADAVRIVREVALALDHAHRHGVVHRDVKPQNILLTEDGQTLLADFGIARAASIDGESRDAGDRTSGRLTGAGYSLGTPTYMSPEQGAGERDVDGRSDQYALACVLYESLAGEPPFTGTSPQAVVAKRFASAAPDVGVLRDGVPRHVRAALARALGRSPADRFPTAADFASALADASTHDTPSIASRRSATRRRIALGLAALALIVATVITWRASVDRSRLAPAEVAPVPAESVPVESRQLTFVGTADEPSFSPDGRQVAYVDGQCERADGIGCTAALRVQDVGSAQSAVLATGEYLLHPFWSADGAWVLVIMKPVDGEPGTYLVPRLGGAPRRLGPPALVAFSATGDTILLAAIPGPGATRFIRRVRAATGETLDSAPLPPALSKLQGLLPSPDGRWTALRLEDRLLLATPDRRVIDSLVFRNAGSLRWDPRGDALYAVVPGVGTNIRLVRARVDARRGRFAGPVETVLTLGKSAGFTFDITRDGRTLVFTSGALTTTLLALDSDARPATRRQLDASTAALGNPHLSSDGQLVGFAATDPTGDNVYVMPFAGGAKQAVTHEASGWEVQGWVPGGHQLLYAGTARPAPLYAQDVPGGTRHVIGQAGALPFSGGGMVELERTGRRLVFRGPAGAERTIALPDSLGGFPSLWAADADGGAAYVRSTGQSTRQRVVRVDRASGTLSEVLDLPMTQVPYVLAAERGTVVYATWRRGGDGNRPTVWRVKAGGPTTRVALLSACDEGTLTMSADGRRFVCAERAAKSDLFLLEHFDRYRR